MAVTIASLRKEAFEALNPIVGNSEANAMIRVIFEDIAKISPVKVAINPKYELTDETAVNVRSAYQRVVAGEPLQYVLGFADFHGLRLTVRPGVLIPRPETSELVDIVLDQLPEDKADLSVLDVCTGSGAIAAALGTSLRFPRLTAVDISADALAVAKENFTRFKLNVEVVESDVLRDGLPVGEFDVIISNPPYVDESERATIDHRVLDNEPDIALFVPDDDPLLFYRKIAMDAFERLNVGGILAFEINPRHASDLVKLIKSMGYRDVDCLLDIHGKKRFIIARL